MVGFLHVRRWEKRNGTSFYREVLLIRINSIEVHNFFSTENYTWRLDIVQNFSCLIFETSCPKIYIRKYLKLFKT